MQQRGFTLIELIIVIVILGILAATAAPKFLDVTSQADTAVAKGIQGNIDASANLVRSAWLIGGSTGGSASIDGDTVAVGTTKGYPTATEAGIGASIDISSGWSQIVGLTTDGAGGTQAAYIFMALDAAPTNDTTDGAICVLYTINTDKPATNKGTFTWVAATTSTCT